MTAVHAGEALLQAFVDRQGVPDFWPWLAFTALFLMILRPP